MVISEIDSPADYTIGALTNGIELIEVSELAVSELIVVVCII